MVTLLASATDQQSTSPEFGGTAHFMLIVTVAILLSSAGFDFFLASRRQSRAEMTFPPEETPSERWARFPKKNRAWLRKH